MKALAQAERRLQLCACNKPPPDIACVVEVVCILIEHCRCSMFALDHERNQSTWNWGDGRQVLYANPLPTLFKNDLRELRDLTQNKARARMKEDSRFFDTDTTWAKKVWGCLSPLIMWCNAMTAVADTDSQE